MMNFVLFALLRWLLRILIVLAPAFAFSNSGGGKWIGELIGRGFFPSELSTLAISVGSMVFILLIKRNAPPLPTAVWPAVIGTLLQVPGVLSESAISWGRFVPGDVSARLADTSVNETVLAVTMLLLLVSSMVRYLLDAGDEVRGDLVRRGLGEEMAKQIVRRTVHLEAATLVGGIFVGLVIFMIVQIVSSVGFDGVASVPTPLLGFAGVLLSAAGVFLFVTGRGKVAHNPVDQFERVDTD